MMNISENIENAKAELMALLGDRCSTNSNILELHGHDESWHSGRQPDAVCFAKSIDEVSQISKICYQYSVPVIPFGTGTGMEGQVVALTGGISVDLSQMNKIIQINKEDFDCTVQAGVTGGQLNKELRHTGLFFSVDPGADASMGGMTATRASGTNTVRYGTMRENVVALKVVLADGRIIKTANRARKSAAGYDLTHLFVGSEGTLGTIVEVTVKIHSYPECISAATVSFEDVESAVNTVILTMQSSIPMARIELLDANQIDAINNFSKTNYPIKPTLFLEFHGSEQGVKEQAILFGAICEEYGGSNFKWTAYEEERTKMWSARHDAAYAAMAVRPGSKAIATDVCVPISRLAECIALTQKDADENCSLQTMMAGHVGDGNFHFVFLVDPDNSDEFAQMKGVYDRLIHRALSMEGSCTGEHGIGIGKQEYLVEEFGENALQVMQAIKVALDPKNIMNPGKKLPAP